ncbi:MAG: hypothetical protein APF77_23770 [Clostridia bacterium BRH_c25]|nr:MAG: hypothetical protein APF77_23770 [Clostridia bacterium BRH_c25]
MSVKNCPICGRIFEDGGVNEVCASCFIENENEIRKVKDYLYENPNNSIAEVSEATGISIRKLKRFLQNERLVSVEK